MDEAAKHSEELIHTYSEDGILLTGALVHRGRTPNGHSRGSANEREGRCRSIYRGSATRRRLGPG
jgi:hypothetical protein